ncbi:MAG: hypothetical protein H7X89_10140 [Rhizobiales bacterium]|nr:hypothetical protein [Hyphomicrobiales bacterium]
MPTLYAVLFEDDDRHADKRPAHMEAHLAFLKKNAKSIVSAGPLMDAKQRTPAGGLWLVTADTAEQVDALVKADPFWPTGLRKSVRILEWKQVHSTIFPV